jgi:hypothetical protein
MCKRFGKLTERDSLSYQDKYGRILKFILGKQVAGM